MEQRRHGRTGREVGVVARSPGQARANAAAADLPPLSPAVMARIAVRDASRADPLVRQRW